MECGSLLPLCVAASLARRARRMRRAAEASVGEEKR
jgi:hypothetical protein